MWNTFSWSFLLSIEFILLWFINQTLLVFVINWALLWNAITKCDFPSICVIIVVWPLLLVITFRTSKSLLWRNLRLVYITIDVRRFISWILMINNRRKNRLRLHIHIHVGLEKFLISRNSRLFLLKFHSR